MKLCMCHFNIYVHYFKCTQKACQREKELNECQRVFLVLRRVKSQKENSSIKHTVNQKKKVFAGREFACLQQGVKSSFPCSGAVENWLAEEEEIVQGSNCRHKNHVPSALVLLNYFTFFFCFKKCLFKI